jgi:hypothetical protein
VKWKIGGLKWVRNIVIFQLQITRINQNLFDSIL